MVPGVKLVRLLVIIVDGELLMMLAVDSVVWIITDVRWSWLVVVAGILLVGFGVDLVGLLVIIVDEELLMVLFVDSVVWIIADVGWSWLVIVVGILLVIVMLMVFGEGF